MLLYDHILYTYKAGRSVENPFRVQGVVRPPQFTDREEALERIAAALRSPGSKLLVYGPRRMGKTSTLVVAADEVEEDGGAVVMADFSTVSSVADLAHRLLTAAGRALGRRWRDLPGELARRLEVSLRLETDPGTGLPVPALDARLRRRPADEQYETFGRLLDGLEEMAREREARLAVVLDEFQEIHRLGGEEAEWRLRSVIQHHETVSYVLAGSRSSLIRRMVGRDRAFYGLVDLLHFGPLEPDYFAGWVDRRMEDAGVPRPGLGERCVLAAGPRTRDVVQLARRAFDLAVEEEPPEVGEERPAVEEERGDVDGLVRRALREIVTEEDDLARVFWEGLTSNQQNVVRAVAAADRGLTTADTRARFALPASGSVTNAVKKLVKDGYLIDVDGAPGYDFDSPFLRGWVVEHALEDVGADASLPERPAGRDYVRTRVPPAG